MASPRLLHPIPVTVELINREQLVADGDARESFHGARQVAAQRVTVKAQRKVMSATEPAVSVAGFSETAKGYILVRTVDLRRLNITLRRGDRIVQFGAGLNAAAADVYLMLSEDMGHYPGQGGATLQKWYYTDRSPATRG